MHSLETLLVYSAVATAIGLMIGIILGQRRSVAGKAQREMEHHLAQLQKQQQTYQAEVKEHFTETAKLVDQLTSSYRDVHNHLAQGAHLLAGETVGESLQSLPEPRTSTANLDPGTISPPLDYAPKVTPHDKGVLNEEFGFEPPTDPEDKPGS